jgi:hypothetical protein
MKTYLQIVVDTKPEDENYIKSSARIRHISKTELIRRVVETTIKDQMFLAILDDSKWDQENGH